MLDHLGHARGELAGFERLQGRHVGDDRLGLLEQADEVPPLGPVEPDLSADARVDHGDEARRAVHQVDAPEVGRRHEPGDVLHHAGPQRHDGGRPVDVGVEQGVVDVLDRPEGLAAVARRESDLEVDVPAAGQVEITDALVGDHDHRPLDPGELPDERQQAGADGEPVAAGGIVDVVRMRVGRRHGLQVQRDRVRCPSVGDELGKPSVVRIALRHQLDDPLARVGDPQQGPVDASDIARDALEHLLGGGDQAEDASAGAEGAHVGGIEHHPAAGRDDEAAPAGELGRHLALELAERLLSPGGEDVGDRPVPLLDQLVGVDELVAEVVGQQPADRRLAGPHEPGEHHVVPVAGGRRARGVGRRAHPSATRIAPPRNRWPISGCSSTSAALPASARRPCWRTMP